MYIRNLVVFVAGVHIRIVYWNTLTLLDDENNDDDDLRTCLYVVAACTRMHIPVLTIVEYCWAAAWNTAWRRSASRIIKREWAAFDSVSVNHS